MYGIVDHSTEFGILYLGGFPPSLLTFFDREFGIPHMAGGRSFSSNLGSIGHWRFESTLARLDWHNPQNPGGRSEFLFVWMHECEICTFRTMLPDTRWKR